MSGKSSPWTPNLKTHERVLWRGKPDPRLPMTLADWLMLTYGVALLLFGLALYLGTVPGSGFLPDRFWSPATLSIPSIIAGLWLAAGRLVWHRFVLRRSDYVLTSDSAYVRAPRFWWRAVRRFPLHPGATFEIEQGQPGNIWLSQTRVPTLAGSYLQQTGFERIADTENVYRMIQGIQAGQT